MVNSPDAPAPEPEDDHREIKTFVVRVFPLDGCLTLIRSCPDEDDFVYLLETIANLHVEPQDKDHESFQDWFSRRVKPAVSDYVNLHQLVNPLERLLWDQLED